MLRTTHGVVTRSTCESAAGSHQLIQRVRPPFDGVAGEHVEVRPRRGRDAGEPGVLSLDAETDAAPHINKTRLASDARVAPPSIGLQMSEIQA